MTTNLFVIANLKQLRTYTVLEFYCLFSEHLVVLLSYFQQFLTFSTIGLFDTILEGLWNFGGLNTPNPPLVRHWYILFGISVVRREPKIRQMIATFAYEMCVCSKT